uniref:Uncharacterized protein n=1 Tax=viral metagenome TaxID=1070528 RepID=A0A6H1ZCR8_9ZZZZ
MPFGSEAILEGARYKAQAEANRYAPIQAGIQGFTNAYFGSQQQAREDAKLKAQQDMQQAQLALQRQQFGLQQSQEQRLGEQARYGREEAASVRDEGRARALASLGIAPSGEFGETYAPVASLVAGQRETAGIREGAEFWMKMGEYERKIQKFDAELAALNRPQLNPAERTYLETLGRKRAELQAEAEAEASRPNGQKEVRKVEAEVRALAAKFQLFRGMGMNDAEAMSAAGVDMTRNESKSAADEAMRMFRHAVETGQKVPGYSRSFEEMSAGEMGAAYGDKGRDFAEAYRGTQQGSQAGAAPQAPRLQVPDEEAYGRLFGRGGTPGPEAPVPGSFSFPRSPGGFQRGNTPQAPQTPAPTPPPALVNASPGTEEIRAAREKLLATPSGRPGTSLTPREARALVEYAIQTQDRQLLQELHSRGVF